MMVVVEKKGRCTSTAAMVVRSYDQVSSPNFFNTEMSSSICAPNSLLSYTQLKSIPNSLHSQPLKRSSSLITRASLSTPKETVLKSFSERRALKIISGLQNFNKDNVASVVTAADKKLQPNFLDLMLKHLKPEPFDRQLRDAFKVIDKDCTGYAVVADLKHILTCIGEKLEPAEFDEWIREVDVGSDGKIKYEDFIARMVAK